MSKTIKRRRAWLVVGGLLVAGLVTFKCLSVHEPTLVEKAHVIAPMTPEKRDWTDQGWNWVSDEELLVVTTDRQPSDAPSNNIHDIDWQGNADLLNIVTGAHKRLQGLTDLLNRENISPRGAPDDFQTSPNRTWLVWRNYRSHQDWPFPAAAHWDGTHFRDWYRDYDSPGSSFFLDDSHWLELLAGGMPNINVLDLGNAGKDQKFPFETPPRKTVIARYAEHHPLFGRIEQDSAQPNRLKISTYSTVSVVPVLVAEYLLHPAPLPLQTHYVHLPQGATLVHAEFSLQQQAIFYDLHIDYTPPLLTWLHRIFPKISDAPTRTENLWVSKADGQDFHEIGQVAVQKGKEEDSGLTYIDWLPGGKKISFLYRHQLYLLPVATPK